MKKFTVIHYIVSSFHDREVKEVYTLEGEDINDIVDRHFNKNFADDFTQHNNTWSLDEGGHDIFFIVQQ